MNHYKIIKVRLKKNLNKFKKINKMNQTKIKYNCKVSVYKANMKFLQYQTI